jgi:hypothetical protein
VLNSSIIQHPEKVVDEEVRQREWLEEELKKAIAGHVQWIVIFQHIPWFLHSADEPDQYFNIPRETRSRYLKILKESGVRYDFAGHFHQNSVGKDDGFEMVTTGPIGKPLGDATSGIRIVSVSERGLCHRYYGLGNLPNQIDVKAFALCAPNNTLEPISPFLSSRLPARHLNPPHRACLGGEGPFPLRSRGPSPPHTHQLHTQPLASFYSAPVAWFYSDLDK